MKPWVMRPWSIGKCPTGDELRAAWANRRRSQKDFIWLLPKPPKCSRLQSVKQVSSPRTDARDYISPEYWVDKDHLVRLYPGRQAPDEEWLERKRAGG